MSDKKAEMDAGMLSFLVCPITHGPLVYDPSAEELKSKQAGLAFPIRNGIPVMLANEARVLNEGK